MHEFKHTTADQIAGVPSEIGPVAPQRRYGVGALDAVLAMLGAVDPALAALVAGIIAVRGERRGQDERAIDLDALAAALAIERVALLPHLLALDQRAHRSLSFQLLDVGWRCELTAVEPAASARRERSDGIDNEITTDAVDADDGSAGGIGSGTIVLAASFVALLDVPHASVTPSLPFALLDADGCRDLVTITNLARSGRGAHLALRRRQVREREPGDLAALLAQEGLPLIVVGAALEDLAVAMLRVELHAGETAPVVLVTAVRLTRPAGGCGMLDDDDDDEFSSAADKLGACEPMPPAVLRKMRSLVLWSVADEGNLPQAELSWLAGCVGPLRHDAAWVRSVIAGELGPGIGEPASSPGVRALARRLADPRDGTAIAAAAQALAAQGTISLDEAAARLASSFVERVASPSPSRSRFDPRLLVCAADALHLLDRAKDALSRGARVLAHGPPGGGKSAYVRELAERMAAGGPIRVVTPADFLARAWGATEKRVRQLWRRAAAEGEVLIVDEFEVICGRRVAGEIGNNALLIRTLTDEWVRALDDFPLVPLLATTNDVAAVDAAVRRRCAFVLAFGDALSNSQERLAWALLLGREPPPAWRACGAAVADIVLAAERCRMLGLADAASLQAAIRTARAERTGNIDGRSAKHTERLTRH